MSESKTTRNQASFSFCTYNNGEYDFFIEDNITGEKVCLHGMVKDIPEEQSSMLSRLFPPCVMSSYDEVTR